MKRIIVTFCLAIFSSILIQAQTSTKAIKAGKLIDVLSGKVLENQIILIDSGKIVAVGNNIPIPEKVEIIDLSNATVLPRLIDCHTHLTFQPSGNYYDDMFRKTANDYSIEATINAKKTFGSITTGKLADIIAVEDNPLNDIHALENTRCAFGRIIRHFFSFSYKYDIKY